jgi:hypothetical protein
MSKATCGYNQPATLASEKAFTGWPVAEYVVLIERSMAFSDYVVYVDESGDHSLQSIDPNFPVFSLVFCIFKKSDFVETVVPVVQRLKFDFWGARRRRTAWLRDQEAAR